jgi:hypothetical protein
MENEPNVNTFLQLFQGRQDVVAEHWISKKTGRSGYSPICSNKFKKGVCPLGTGKSCDDCQNKKLVPMSDALLKQHFNGRCILGVYPLLTDANTHFIAFDIDQHEESDPEPFPVVQAIVEVLESQEVPFYVEKSKSGRGFHIWIFFSGPVPAWKARLVGRGILEDAGVFNDQSFDRMFPNQDELEPGGLGNLIALPFQGRAAREGNTLFQDPKTDYQKPFEDQWAVVDQALDGRVPESMFDELIDFWSLKRDEPPHGERGTQKQGQGASEQTIGTIDCLSFSVKQLIENGTKKGDRSEAIGSVLSAMVRANVPEEEIIQCFESKKIGEKYREKGSGRVKWLQDEIARTRGFIGKTNNAEWPEPQPIRAELLPVEPLQESMIPEALLPMVKDVAHRMSVSLDFVAIPLIVTISSVIGTGCRIRPKRHDDWEVTCNLWGALVGAPSQLKTPAMDEVIRRTLGRLETEESKAHKKVKKEWMSAKRAAKLKKTVLEGEYKSALKTERKEVAA